MSVQPAHYSQCGCHTAQGDRQVLSSLVCTEGVALDVGGGLQVTPTSPPTLAVQVATGNAFVQGDNVGWQGLYHVSNDAIVTLPVDAADPALDRIDLVVAQVRDSTYTGSSCDWQLVIIPGTPGSPPVAPSVPINAVPLAQYAVTADAGSVSTVTDLRTGYQLCPSGQLAIDQPVRLVVASSTSIDFAAAYPWCKRAIAQGVGAGAGGGAADVTGGSEIAFGRGGGGGAYARVEIFPELLAAALSITIGQGGRGGGPSPDISNGLDGGDTILSDGTTTVTLGGGKGGATVAPSGSTQILNIGGAGGAVSGAAGGTGWLGEIETFGGRHGMAGSSYPTLSAGRGGDGGGSYRTEGGYGKSSTSGFGPGSAGGFPGGGGGGAYNGPSQSVVAAGGFGANAQVILYLYAS